MLRICVLLLLTTGTLCLQGSADSLETFRPIYARFDQSIKSGNPAAYFVSFAARNYVLVDEDGTRKNLQQVISALNQAFQNLPKTAELQVATTLQRVESHKLGLEVEVLGRTHLEETIEDAKTGAISGTVADTTFSHTWIRTANGWKLLVEKVLSRKQKIAGAQTP